MKKPAIVQVIVASETHQADGTLSKDPRWLALYVLCAGVLMIVLDTTIVNVALPSIRTDLGFSETSQIGRAHV